MAFSQTLIAETQLEEQRYGFSAITLTDWATSAEAAIGESSIVMIGGSVFNGTSETAITGYTAATTAATIYIKLTVSGTTLTAAYTSTAPEWNTIYQYYSSSAESATDRIIGGGYKTSNTQMDDKFIIDSREYGTGHLGLSFITGASILWDEAEDEIIINKQLKMSDKMITDADYEYADHSGTVLKLQSGVGPTEFDIKKPISAYIVGGALNGGDLDIYQGGSWREVATVGASGTELKLMLCPGLYRLEGDAANADVTLYCSGVFGRPTIVAEEIVT